MQKFKGIRQDWFKKYAFPVNDGLYTISSDDLEDWEPLNHSCEPNIWYGENELTLVAMRNIEAGEELMIDYCLFSSDKELEFECACGHKECRKKVTGQDYQKKDLIKKYQGHFYIPVQNKVAGILKESSLQLN